MKTCTTMYKVSTPVSLSNYTLSCLELWLSLWYHTETPFHFYVLETIPWQTRIESAPERNPRVYPQRKFYCKRKRSMAHGRKVLKANMWSIKGKPRTKNHWVTGRKEDIVRPGRRKKFDFTSHLATMEKVRCLTMSKDLQGIEPRKKSHFTWNTYAIKRTYRGSYYD